MNRDSPSSDLTIRPAIYADIVLIRDIVYQTWPITYTHLLGAEQVDYMMNMIYSSSSLTRQMKNDQSFLLAFIKSQHIGFASYSKIEATIFKLEKLYVLPTVQKTGAGKALLQKVEETVKGMGAAKLQLNVNRKNIAKSFYEKNGFCITKEVDIDIGNGYFMNDYVMQKDV